MIVPKLRSPIVLVHGLLGYDRLTVGGRTLASYFATIPELLTGSGNRVLVPKLSPTGGVAERAAQLKGFLDQNAPQGTVHIIAHSMGGLDARYLIRRLDMASRVLTLTTLGTPHRGTAFADWGVGRFERVLTPICQRLAVPLQAFYDLTTAACQGFNEQVPDAPTVRYFSVAGCHEGGWLSPEWQLSHRIVTRAEGANDGVVSIASAKYGEDCEIWQGDHFSLVNWLNPVSVGRGLCQERSSHYAALVRRLADEGF
jgi:triacylglycerol lipase